MIESHSLEFGQALSEAFEDMGFRKNTSTAPLHERMICIVSDPMTGKSTLLQSIPDAIIIDTDMHGYVNPRPKAMLLPEPGADINLPHPSIEGKRVTEMSFDYCRIAVERAIALKKANPSMPVMVVIDSLTTLVELRIKKLEIDMGDPDKGTIKPFADMNSMQAWPVISTTIRDLFLSLRAHSIGCIFTLHTTTKKSKVMVRGDKGQRTMETVARDEITVPSSILSAIGPKIDEGFRLSKSVRTVQDLREVRGKKVKGGTSKKVTYMLYVEDDPDEEVSEICGKRIPTLPDSFEWEEGEFDIWTNVIRPAYEQAAEDFQGN